MIRTFVVKISDRKWDSFMRIGSFKTVRFKEMVQNNIISYSCTPSRKYYDILELHIIKCAV